MIARCASCKETFTAPTLRQASDRLWAHDLTDHRGQQAEVVQLPSVTFHEQALAAIRALALTGKPFTIGEAHPMVTAQPSNPAVDWPRAQREAESLGWISHAGYTKSIVPGTKGSACSLWTGTAKAKGRAA